MNTIYIRTKLFYEVVKSSKKKTFRYLRMHFANTSVGNLKGPESIGNCSIENSFLPSCFEIRCEGFLLLQQRN